MEQDKTSAVSGAAGSEPNVREYAEAMKSTDLEVESSYVEDGKELNVLVSMTVSPQVAAKCVRPQLADGKIVPQLVEQLVCVPWGHHRTIIDKCKGNLNKALFYVHRTIQNGWSRDVLLNWLSTDLYEREGKEHNRVLAKFHLEKLGLPMGVTDCQIRIWHTRVPNLSWSHFRAVMRVSDPIAREWYKEGESA